MPVASSFRLGQKARMKFNETDSWLSKILPVLLPVEISDGTDRIQRDGQRGAAVLMPLVLRPTRDGKRWFVILTQRPETMPSHAGQIAFPGGKREKGESIAEAVLRETEEEIGVTPEQVDLIGRLLSFNATGQYRVTPFVGIVDPSAVITPDPREVADVFEVPLDFLMNVANHKPRDIEYGGKTHRLWDMPYDGPDGVHRNIWGMTAMTIYRLYQRAILGVFETEF